MTYKKAHTFLLIIFCFCGCATQEISSQNVDQYIADFKSGNIELSISPITSANDAIYDNQMITLYNREDWAGLAKLVIKSNSSNDFSWYLLGRSAEGLGYTQAAIVYYNNSITAMIKDCSPPQYYIAGVCRGIQLPYLARVRLQGLEGY